MARSTGSIHIADNSVTAINDAIQQLLFMIDEIRGEHNTTFIKIGPHSHAGSADPGAQDGGNIDIPAQEIDHDDLINVTSDQHHNKLHSTTHGPGGIDTLKLDDLAAPDDNTDLNASASMHGLMQKYPNDGTKFLDGTGAFVVPVISGTEATDVTNVEGSEQELPFEFIIAGANITVTEMANGNALKIASSGGGEIRLSPLGYEPPSSAYATLDSRNVHPVLDFDGATDEEAVWSFVLPVGYQSGGLTVDIWVTLETVTTGSLRFQGAIERVGTTQDVDSDSFAAFNSAGGSANGTNGIPTKITITFADGSEMDSLAAGELGRFKLRRDADGTSGTGDITEDANVLMVTIRETIG